MSSQINISSSNISGKCDLKCSYSFNYQETNLTAYNNGSYITLQCDTSTTSPVTYNDQKYNVSTIYIVSPSIHLYNNSSANAEILIQHTAATGGPDVYVVIPIILSNNLSTSSTILTEVINSISSGAPGSGDSLNVNISNFNLNHIVPKKPFFSYTDTENNFWIVYGIATAISLNSSTIDTLQNLIHDNPITSSTTSGVFFNSIGPNAVSHSSDGIYISCQPTGNSEEEIGILNSDNNSSSNQTSYDLFSTSGMKSFLIYIIFAVFIVLFFLGINYGYSYFMGSTNVALRTAASGRSE